VVRTGARELARIGNKLEGDDGEGVVDALRDMRSRE
jgi:hypothetical protein